MSTPGNPERAFLDAADNVPDDDPILQRPYSLPIHQVVEAAGLIMRFPDNKTIQRYAIAAATFRITPEEYAALVDLCRAAAAEN